MRKFLVGGVVDGAIFDTYANSRLALVEVTTLPRYHRQPSMKYRGNSDTTLVCRILGDREVPRAHQSRREPPRTVVRLLSCSRAFLLKG